MGVQHGREGAVATVTASGHYGTAELREAIDAALASFDGEGAKGLLFDLSTSEALPDRSAKDLHAMAYFLASRAGRYARRLAMVAVTDLAYGMMRMGSAVAESQGIAARVFRDRASAMAWLGPTDH
jgi:hypothetical protein